MLLSADTRNKTACFSGHRPAKLPESGNEYSESTKIIRNFLYKQIMQSIEDGYRYFITGLARGIDLWAGEMLCEIKSENNNISIISALPYRQHGITFKGRDKSILNEILTNSSDIVCLSPCYTKDCMKKRNYYMVDNSSRLIAVVSDYKSGTGQTIKYAMSEGLDIRKYEIPDTSYEQTSLLL